MTNYLEHVGVKGMKWGVRKKNPNYSKNQQTKDKEVYGSSSVGRINKSMNKGLSISTARSKEKTRKDNTMARSKTIKKAGTVAGTVGGAALGWNAPRLARAGAAIIGSAALATRMRTKNKTIRSIADNVGKAAYTANRTAANLQYNTKVKASLATLGATSMSQLTGRQASRGYVKAKGYNPNRK